MPELQMDLKKRVVVLANLEAMCARISGMCHNFRVERVTKTRVEVSYSNPDEWGSEHPMIAVFPAYPFGDTTAVVLDILRVKHDNWHGEGWQAFGPVLDCPTLWRDPNGEGWRTHNEIVQAQTATGIGVVCRPDTCTVCDLPLDKLASNL